MYAGLVGGLAGKCAVAKPDAQSPGPHSARGEWALPRWSSDILHTGISSGPSLAGKKCNKIFEKHVCHGIAEVTINNILLLY